MSSNNSNMTISEVAAKLNVSSVRVHGLIKDGKLTVAKDPVLKGSRFVAAVTNESVEALLAKRAERAINNGSRQYILALDATQVAELTAAGYSLRPRFEKAAK